MDSKRAPGRSDARPINRLLQRLTEQDYKLIRHHLELGAVSANQVLYHPGDQIEALTFPCAATVIGVAVSVEQDREVHATIVGAEGVVGSIVGRTLPSYTRAQVLAGGSVARLSIRRLEHAMRLSSSLRAVIERYMTFLLAQAFQFAACNAGHSNEQRIARCILSMSERTGKGVPLTHEQLAGLLGVGRSYTSRLIEGMKAAGIVETRRGAIQIVNEKALRDRVCACHGWINHYFDEIFGSGRTYSI
jgi:CRP-like cAMP-binding protein